jgi:DNA-binding transcriptional ArsR family regulator
MVLETVDQVSAIGSPLRREMLEILGRFGPASVAEVAKRIGIAPTALHYHAKVLLQAKLIFAVEVRQVRARQETVYDRAADEFVIDPIGKPVAYVGAIKRAASAIQVMASKDHDAAIDQGLITASNTWVWRGTAILSEGEVKRARELLNQLRTLFDGAESTGLEPPVSLTVFMTPAVRRGPKA